MKKHHLYFGSNLKLSKGIGESARFAADICALLRPEDLSGVTAFIIPSYLAIPGVRDAIGTASKNGDVRDDSLALLKAFITDRPLGDGNAATQAE